MEENNEQEKSALEKGVDTTKRVVKNKVKKGIFNLIKPILPYIALGVGIFFLALLAVGLTMVVQKVVMDTFNSILGIVDSSVESTIVTTGKYSSDILEAAKQVSEEEMDWIYYTEHEKGLSSLKSPVDLQINNSDKTTCCASYVATVLYASGYMSSEEIGNDFHSARGLEKQLKKYWGEDTITNREEIKPGYIVFLDDGNNPDDPDHVQIYAGDDKWYNGGRGGVGKTMPQYQASTETLFAGWEMWWAYSLPEEGPQYSPASRTITENMETSSSLKDQGLIEIDETGAYKLKEKDLGKKIREELEKQKVNNGVMGFELGAEDVGAVDEETIEDIIDMIDKYIKAEIQTTYPRIQDENKLFKSDIDGIITIKRASISDGKVIELEYVPYEKFKNNLAIDKFSINPENFKLCLAVRNGDGLVLKEFNYQKYVQNYSVPLNFFISLHLISQDADFMNEVVDMVLGKNKENPIELTYVETVNISTTSYNYTGTAEIINDEPSTDKQDELTTPMIKDQPNESTEPIIKPTEEITNDNVREYYEEAKDTTTSEYYSGELYVTNADTWLKSSGYEIGNITTTVQSGYNSDEEPVKEEDGVFIYVSTTTTNSKKTFTLTEKESKITVDDFVDLIRKYPKVEDNITSAPSALFHLLQQNERTQRLERIMRYVVYKLTDVDYGVLEEQLEGLLEDIFSEMTDFDIGSIVVKTDEMLAVKEVDKEQLEEIITKNFSGKEKDNLLSVIDELLYIQEKYKVSPVFAIAVLKNENNYENFNETILDFGSYISETYFSDEKYTITEIGAEKGEAWIKSKANLVIKMYESIGINVAIEGATELQRKVVEVALNYQDYGIVAYERMCQKWVSDVYAVAGANEYSISRANATLSGEAWGVSSDWDSVPLGACVWGNCNEDGHVGIYVGDGLVAHNLTGKYTIDELDVWVYAYSGFCWGWNGGVDLTKEN